MRAMIIMEGWLKIEAIVAAQRREDHAGDNGTRVSHDYYNNLGIRR